MLRHTSASIMMEWEFMVQLIPIDERIAIAGQLHPADLPEVAAAGITCIVNNRPDGESWGQPKAKELAEAAAKHGIAYADLPFKAPPAIQPAQVAELARFLGETEGRVLAFCRSGMRSSVIVAAAMVAQGVPLMDVLAKTAKAGYDLRQAAPFIEYLANAAHANVKAS